LIDPQLAVIVQGISGIALLHDDQYLLVRDGRGAMADANVLLQLRLVLGDITHGRRTLQPMFQSQHRLQNMSGSVLMPAVAGQLTPLHPPLTPMDAEGLAVSRHGTVWIADEASATLRAFDQSGQETRVIHLPAVYDVPMNSQLPGRTRWRGLCGVSLTPDERYLFTTTKSPTPADGGSQGIWLRVLRIDLKTGKTVQYPLALEAPVCLVSDLLALDSQKLLVLEYDLQVLDGFQRARVTQVNLTGADDVSHVDALPLSEHPQWFSGVGKQVRIDLNHDFPTRRNLPRPMFQAMCLGPLDSRGHPTLLLASDNLAQAGYPTVFALYPLPQ
jgi:sugar lactone lactonase YvrE